MGVLNQRLVDISLNKVKERLRLEGVMVGEDINFICSKILCNHNDYFRLDELLGLWNLI